VIYILTICAHLLSEGCARNTFAFPTAAACERARAVLRGEFDFARCEAIDRRSALTREPEPFKDSPDTPAR
jgi:hypothetical protein